MTDSMFLNGGNYVLNLDAAINFPEILDIEKNAPICDCLIIPIGVYNSRLRVWEDEDSDRGFVAIELACYLMNITNKSALKGTGENCYFEYTYKGGNRIILDPQNRDGNSQSSGEHTIGCAKFWDATIITSKSSLIIDAKSRGVKAYFLSPEIYSGFRQVIMPTDLLSLWQKKSDAISASDWASCFNDQAPLVPNEFVEFVYPEGESTGNYENIGMFNPTTEKLEHLKYFNCGRVPHNVTPKNARQAMAFEAAFAGPERDLPCVIFYGAAGCGKTFISLTAAISQTDLRHNSGNLDRIEQTYQGNLTKKRSKKQRAKEEVYAQAQLEYEAEISAEDEARNTSKELTKERRRLSDATPIYDQIWCCPPDRMMGDKIGAVPGDRWAKLRDYLDGFSQNIQALLKTIKDKKKNGEEMTGRDIQLRAESIMRSINFTSPGQLNGDSFTDTFFLLDEAEFMKEAQIRTAIERIAEGSKIIISGDPRQTRNPYGWYGNPLARVIRRLEGDKEVAILRFEGEQTQRKGAGIIYRNYYQVAA